MLHIETRLPLFKCVWLLATHTIGYTSCMCRYKSHCHTNVSEWPLRSTKETCFRLGYRQLQSFCILEASVYFCFTCTNVHCSSTAAQLKLNGSRDKDTFLWHILSCMSAHTQAHAQYTMYRYTHKPLDIQYVWMSTQVNEHYLYMYYCSGTS